jgi:hypothetical protein
MSETAECGLMTRCRNCDTGVDQLQALLLEQLVLGVNFTTDGHVQSS